MIKLTVLYPAGEGLTFDMDYYETKHAEIVMRVLKPIRFEIDKRIDGPYLAISHVIFDSNEALQAGMASPDAGEAIADVPNFTNATPQMQISETAD